VGGSTDALSLFDSWVASPDDRALHEDIVVVTFDGSMQSYEVFELAQYGKTELPFDRVFSERGSPVVTLISRGGVFDRSAGSYEDNIVAYARPVPG
jgi:hypothetical protein